MAAPPSKPLPTAVHGYGQHYAMPLAAVFLLLLLTALFLSHRNYLGLARERDLARVQRYVDLSKAVFEARFPETDKETILQELRSFGLDTVELLPLDQKPAYGSPSHGKSALNAEAWTIVHDSENNPVGVLKIARVDDSAVLALTFIRFSFFGAIVIFAMLLVAGWLIFRKRIVKRAVEMGQLLHSPEAPDVPESVEPMDFLESAIKSHVRKLEEQAKIRQLLLDGHSEAACVGTLEGVLREVNAAYCGIFNKTREQLVGSNYLDLIPPSDRNEVVASLRRLSSRHPENVIEHRIVRSDGSLRWMRWRDRAVFGDNDRVLETLSFGTDITAEKELEARLAGMQFAFDQMQSLARTGSLTWDIGTGRMAWTDETFRLLGLERDDTLPSLGALLESVVPEDRQAVRTLFERAREDGDPFEHEFRAALPDGSRRVLQSRAEVRADPKTKLLNRLTCTLRDITALRDAESATRRELRFREAIEQSLAAGIAVSDEQGHILVVNPAFCQMTGWSSQELIGVTAPYPYWPEEEIPNIRRAFESALAGQTPPHGYELRFCRKDGTRFDALVKVAPLLDSEDNQLGWLGAVTDITEIQQTRRELRAAEDSARRELLYRQAVDQSTTVGLITIGLDGRPVSVNEAYGRMLGYSQAEIMAMVTPCPFWPETEREKIEQAFALHLAGKTPPEGFNLRFQHKDGHLVDVLITAAPVYDAHGEQIGVLSALTDITALQESRRRLHATNERLQIAQDVAEFGIWDWDPVGDTLHWDRQSFAIFGHPDATNAEEVWREVHSEEEQERLTYGLQRLIATGGTSGQDRIRARWPDGTLHDILSTYVILRDEKGRATRVVGINRDVTGELEEERELRDANERLAAALEGGQFGTFEHIIGVGDVNWSPANYEINGIDPSVTDPAELFELWRRSTGLFFEELLARMNALPVSESHLTYEFTARPPRHEARRIRTSVFIERSKQGHPVRLVGITRRVD